MANIFIVPHDFTSAGDSALNYALFLAKPRKTKIELLHLVDNKNKGKAVYEKLQKIIANLKLGPLDVEVVPLVKVGTIFGDIGKLAEEKEAKLVIMGTHGAKGIQRFFGSYAIKVVTSATAPFIIVQEGVSPTKIKNIVVPIDLTKESLQVINCVSDLARLFDAHVHIIAEEQKDPRLAQQIKIRISLIKKEYQEKEIKSDIQLLKGRKAYHKKVLKFAIEKDADIIAWAYHSSSIFPQFEKFHQRLLTNKEKIPSMIVNSKLLSKLYY